MPRPIRAASLPAAVFRAGQSGATPWYVAVPRAVRLNAPGFRRVAMAGLALIAVAALSACKPTPPDPERPPEPQAHGELRDAVQAPVDRARAVEDELQQAAEAQRAAIHAAGG